MKWRRMLRYMFVALGLGFAVALVLFRRTPPDPVEPAVGLPSDPAAIAESSGGRLVHSRDGNVRFVIDHKGQRSYPDGRSQFLSAHVVFPESGREVRADTIETRGQLGDREAPMHLVLKGNVSMVQGEDFEVRAGEGTYDDAAGLLDLPGAVTFRKGTLSGSGVGATYDGATDLFLLREQAQATIGAGDATGTPMTMTAAEMGFTSTQHHLQLTREARIVRPAETLTGDQATMTFGADTTSIKFLELRGHAAVTPTDASSTVPAMAATDITLGFLEPAGTLEHATLTGAASITFREAAGERSVAASWLDLYLAPDGQTVTRLDGRDRVVVRLPAGAATPAREIRSTLLTGRGTPEQGLQSARFERAVTFVERRPAGPNQPAEERTGVAEVMTLALDGGFDAIREAVFERAVTFTTPASKAEADRGVYDATGGRLRLERGGQTSARRPRASRVDGSFTVDADRIDLSIDTEDLVATTNVSSQMRSEEEKGGGGSTMFEAGKPVYGSADRLEYTKASGTATYQGTEERPARLTQGDNRVAGVTVVVEESTNNLRATTRVDSTFVETPTETGVEPGRSRISAASLVYDEAAGTATYAGAVVFRSADSEVEGDRLVLTLGPNRTVTAFEATGPAVFAKLAGGHEATGTRLSYNSATKMYTLHGKPARARSPNETEGDCLLTVGPQVSLAPGRAAQWQPVTGVVESRKVPCTGSIR